MIYQQFTNNLPTFSLNTQKIYCYVRLKLKKKVGKFTDPIIPYVFSIWNQTINPDQFIFIVDKMSG